MKKYISIAQELEHEIRTGVWPVGARLPVEPELCARFSVARQTLRQAVSLLEEQGMVERVQGSGTYVRMAQPSPTKQNTVCIMTTYLDDGVFPGIISGAEEVLSEAGCSIQMRLTRNRVAAERQNLQEITAGGCAGLIVEGTRTALFNPNLPLYRELGTLPIVFINGWSAALGEVNYVTADDRGGAELQTRYLISRGHRRIGGVCKLDDVQGLRRHAGYLNVMLESGLSVDEENVCWYTTETEEQMFTEEFAQWLRRYSAVVCYNDKIAVRVQRFAVEQGIRVPEDLSIIGFDNTAPAEATGLTTLQHPCEALGSAAAKAVLTLMEHPEQTIQITMPVTLVERSSVCDCAEED